MNCDRVGRWLVTEGGATWDEERDRIRRHLACCPACRERAAQALREAEVLREILSEVPVAEDFTERVLERIRVQTPMP